MQHRTRPPKLHVYGLPEGLPPVQEAEFRGRVDRAVRLLSEETGLRRLDLSILLDDSEEPWPSQGPHGHPPRGEPETRSGSTDQADLAARMTYFKAVDPAYSLDRLVLPQEALEQLHLAADTLRLRAKVFDEWNLRDIEPYPRSAINLYGAPGTGKTLAAHALAHHLGMKILAARTSQLESKYHGEGGKYLAAMFEVARRSGAVLFIDEAESLVSRRFESVSQGSEHAVNTLRSELVQHMDTFEGVVVFATNLVESYDPAINSRLQHVHIPKPDHAARAAIWRRHLPKGLPLADDVSVEELARIQDVVGRDIKRAVIAAAVTVARENRTVITQTDLRLALSRIVAQRPPVPRRPDGTSEEDALTSEEHAALEETITRQISGGRAQVPHPDPNGR